MARPSKNYSKREEKQDRKFACIFYDDDDIEFKLNRLQYFWDLFWYIKHDSDVWTETDSDTWPIDHNGDPFPYVIGSLKKPHYHVVAYSNNPVTLGRAAIKFDIPSNRVQAVKSLKGAVRYLIHLDDPGKFQYDSSFLISNDPDLDKKLKIEKSVDDKATLLLDIITNSKSYIPLSTLSVWALKNGCWDEFRRGQHLFISLLSEHNSYYCKKYFPPTNQFYFEN